MIWTISSNDYKRFQRSGILWYNSTISCSPPSSSSLFIVNFDILDLFSLEVLLEEGRKVVMHKTLRINCPLSI